LLYTSYSDKLLEFHNKHKKVAEYDSENLMNALIDKVLNIEEYNSLEKILHYSLNAVIKDTSSLNEEELRFASNILTHVDFMIFRKYIFLLNKYFSFNKSLRISKAFYCILKINQA